MRFIFILLFICGLAFKGDGYDWIIPHENLKTEADFRQKAIANLAKELVSRNPDMSSTEVAKWANNVINRDLIPDAPVLKIPVQKKRQIGID